MVLPVGGGSEFYKATIRLLRFIGTVRLNRSLITGVE